ncbi:MAG: phosphoribosyl-AMP cyclohydrolase [Pseudomonadota bacterium]
MKPATQILSAIYIALISGGAFAGDQGITVEEVIATQKKWGDALVEISTAYDNEGPEAARDIAISAIDALYNFDGGSVFFKPTLAQEPQRFRSTKEGTLAYFIGDNPEFPQDSGFALMGWRDVAFTDALIFTDNNIGLSMGDVTFTDTEGNTVSVDKTWGFQKQDNGEVKMIIHHSSLPYTE